MNTERRTGVVLSYIQVILNVLVNIIYVPVLLHYLGQSEYGLYQIVGSFFSYVTVFESCMSAGVLRNYCNALGKQDKQLADETLSTARSIYRLMAAGMAGLGVIVILGFRAFYASSFTGAELQESTIILGMLFCNMVATLLGSVYLTVITGQERFVFLKISGIILQTVQPLLVILCVMRLPYAMSVTAVIAVVNIINILLRRWYVRHRLNIRVHAQRQNPEVAKEILLLSSTILIGCIADQIFWKTDQVILGKMFNTATVAVYSVGAQIYLVYMQFGTQIPSIFYPRVSILYQEENGNKKVSDLFVKVGRVTFMIIMLILSGFVVFGKEFLLIWVGEGYTEAYYVAIMVMIPFSIDLAQNLALVILQVKKQYGFRARIYLLGAFINIITTVILASYFGIIGAALSTGLSMAIASGLIMNWYYLRRAKLDIVKFWKEASGIIAAAAFMTILTLCIKRYVVRDGAGIFFLGVEMVLFALIYVGVLYRFIMTPEEKKQIHIFVKRR